MLSEVTSALSSLKIAAEIIKGFNSLKLEAAIKEKIVELLNIIISLQHSMFSYQSEYEKILSQKINMEKELSELKEWRHTKNKYILKEVSPDVLAYIHKKQKDSVSEKHWLCANCFDTRKTESIYQIKQRGNYQSIYYCPNCKNEILILNPDYKPIEKSKRVSSRKNFVTDWKH